MARSIAARKTVEAIAESLGVSRETVRSQLDLVALLAGVRIPRE